MSNLIKVTGLWRNEKDGKVYLSGKIGDCKIFVFQNQKTEGSNQPDYTLHIDGEAYSPAKFDVEIQKSIAFKSGENNSNTNSNEKVSSSENKKIPF